MSTINVKVTDHVLTLTNTPVISSGSENVDTIQFEFDSLWDGYGKVVVFWSTEQQEFSRSIVDNTDKCSVPNRMIQEAGKISFAITGVKSDNVRTSNVVTYDIVEGVFVADPDPDPDVYQQILTLVGNTQTDFANTTKMVNETLDSMAYVGTTEPAGFNFPGFYPNIELIEEGVSSISGGIDCNKYKFIYIRIYADNDNLGTGGLFPVVAGHTFAAVAMETNPGQVNDDFSSIVEIAKAVCTFDSYKNLGVDISSANIIVIPTAYSSSLNWRFDLYGIY